MRSEQATDSAASPVEAAFDDRNDPAGEQALHAQVTDEMGETIAEAMRLSRKAQQEWHRRQHPEEGLRERKGRLTRQLISDAATALFVTRGFDLVRVAEVADRVGVSEKTVYNYFPTKESMVLDGADEDVNALATALRDRPAGESISAAVVRSLKADMDRYDQVPEALVLFVPMFAQMIEDAPTLRAAWLELHDRLARVARDELAAAAGIDPHDPEPIAAGRALASLPEIALQSRVRHTRSGQRGPALRDAIVDDLERAARLLETGLWSFNLPPDASATDQTQRATRAAERDRARVLKALRKARAARAKSKKRSITRASDVAREAKQVAQQSKHVGDLQ